MRHVIYIFFCFFCTTSFAQYFQQDVNYSISLNLDTSNHTASGDLNLIYKNNSLDTLGDLYLHLYYQAFQPNSMMDVRSKNISDPDKRLKDKIQNLKLDEQGIYKIESITINGTNCEFEILETLLKIINENKIAPNETTTIKIRYALQIPVLVRRGGRTNKEGIDYSMSQWYPKIAAYDHDGWHLDPYISREFYGEFGDFNVSLNLPQGYKIAHTGLLKKHEALKKDRVVYTIEANNVHDFAWSADLDYEFFQDTMYDGVIFNYYCKAEYVEEWKKALPYIKEGYAFISPQYGQYPYEQYTFAQGGDGGMEYPMITLMTANRTKGSIMGTGIHELIHSWYQGILGSNEAKHAWLDEGFTVYLTNKTLKHVLQERNELNRNFEEEIYKGISQYQRILMNQHSDHFPSNREYGIAAYTKGAYFLSQLEYIVGEQTVQKILLAYFNKWKFKHPSPLDFLKVAEDISGIQLDWYLDYFVNTRSIINYSIDEVIFDKKTASITITNKGEMPMPLDFTLYYLDKKTKTEKSLQYTSPLYMMFGNKTENIDFQLPYHRWVDPSTVFEIPLPKQISKLLKIELGTGPNFGDIEKSDNIWINKNL